MKRLAQIFLICILLMSCHEQNKTTLRIGTNIWPGYEPFYVTKHKHADNIKNIKLVEYRNASQVLNGIINNSIDVAAVTLDEAVKLKALGFDIEVVWVIDTSDGADALMAKSVISEPEDLIGKRIGAETSALGLYFMSRYFALHNLDMSDVELINLEANRHVQAFKSNEVDAVFTFEPSVSKLRELGAASLFDSSKIPGEIVDVLIVNNTTINAEKKSLLVSFLKLNNQTNQHITKDITPYVYLLNKRLNLDEPQLINAFKQVRLLYDSEVMEWLKNHDKQQLLIKEFNQVLLSLGKIDTPCSCQNLVNLNYAKQVFNEK